MSHSADRVLYAHTWVALNRPQPVVIGNAWIQPWPVVAQRLFYRSQRESLLAHFGLTYVSQDRQTDFFCPRLICEWVSDARKSITGGGGFQLIQRGRDILFRAMRNGAAQGNPVDSILSANFFGRPDNVAIAAESVGMDVASLDMQPENRLMVAILWECNRFLSSIAAPQTLPPPNNSTEFMQWRGDVEDVRVLFPMQPRRGGR